MLLYLSVKISVITLRNPETLAVRFFRQYCPTRPESSPDPTRVQSSPPPGGPWARPRPSSSRAAWPASLERFKRPFHALERIRPHRICSCALFSLFRFIFPALVPIIPLCAQFARERKAKNDASLVNHREKHKPHRNRYHLPRAFCFAGIGLQLGRH